MQHMSADSQGGAMPNFEGNKAAIGRNLRGLLGARALEAFEAFDGAKAKRPVIGRSLRVL